MKKSDPTIRERVKLVIRQPDGSYTSAFLDTGPLRVSYELGEFVRATPKARERGYHLLAYADLEAALDGLAGLLRGRVYVPGGAEAQLYNCETRGELPLPVYCRRDRLRQGRFFRYYHPFTWPPGTIMAREVRLTEPISLPEDFDIFALRK